MNTNDQFFNKDIEIIDVEVEPITVQPADDSSAETAVNPIAAGVAGAAIGSMIGGKIGGKTGAVLGAVAGAVAGGWTAKATPDDAGEKN